MQIRVVVFETVRILFETGVKRELITYGDFLREINRAIGDFIFPERGVGMGSAVSRLIHPICTYFYRNFGVLPGSVVVSKRSGMPSEGYFKFLESLGFRVEERSSLWRELLENFYAFCEVYSGSNGIPYPLPDTHSVCVPPHHREGKSLKGNSGRG